MEEEKKLTREERKRQKEIEEARKAGTMPAELDEEGKEINPHIPQYIKNVPWYFGKNEPSLKHQRPQIEKNVEYSDVNARYIRGKPTGPIAKKYKPGSCENCGATTHKKKDCMERPRKLGAKFTNKDIQPDDYVQNQLNFDYDGKRDHWASYDTEEHNKIVEEYAKVERLKQKLKAEKLEEELKEGNKNEDLPKNITKDSIILSDDDKYGAVENMPGQKFDAKQRLTVRNLRIREDTAKYLYNLDLDSAFYDPKSRSMRENPLENDEKSKMIAFKGENECIYVEQVKNVSEAQLFAWEAAESGVDVNLQADPTKAELLLKQYKNKSTDHKQTIQSKLLDKYGGDEYLHAPPQELLFSQTEEYVEYSHSGKVIKGQERAFIKSKYEEDIFINNHTSVWGSFWKNFQWGYSCCHSFIKNSYCIGLKINKNMFSLPILNDNKLINENNTKKRKNDEINNSETNIIDNKKLKKNEYNSTYYDKTPTDKEMEEYHKTKLRPNDPMINYKNN